MVDNEGGGYMESNPIEQITAEVESRTDATDVGMLTLRTANRTLKIAAMRPDPEDLYNGLWYEGEVCCLFADSNVGKSIYAVQMADEIAQLRNVLYVDCELSDKQFQLRYTDRETGQLHQFPETLIRAEINPSKMDMKNFEEQIINDIERAAQQAAADTIMIDNLTYLCNSSEKGDQAGIFMMKLMNLKMKYNWSLLIIAHTPKRNMTNPITQNDLAGSKKLYNFFDSVFAIGKSAADSKLRYVKQVKVRAGEYRYDADNVIVYEIEHEADNVRFAFKGFAKESEHLKAFASTVARQAFSSSFASSRISSSLSSSSSARLSSMPSFAALYSLYASTISERSVCSFMSLRNRFWSLTTIGSLSSS